MTKNRQTNNRIANRSNNNATGPQPAQGEGATAAPMGETETAHTVVSLRPNKGERKNIFEMDILDVSENTGHKLQVIQEARQRLAEAKDLWDASNGTSAEAEEISAKAALLVTTARITGEMTADEVTSTLGDIFGFKAKADGSPSKTPKGQGEAIRKRIVRIAAASEFLRNGAQEGFFKGVSPDTAATVTLKDGRTIEVTSKDVFDMVLKGEIGFWAGYEAFAAIKRSLLTPVPLAFNAKRIMEIAETLQRDGSAKQFVNNAALRKAYSSLWAIIRVVGVEAGELAAEAA